MGRASSLAISGLLASTAAAAPGIPNLLKRQGEATNSTSFSTITPSSELKWTQCFQHLNDNLQCSYLTVPLDYEKPEDGTVDIAYMRYLVSEDAEDLLFNPGGPGEQGTTQVAQTGEEYATKWGMNFVSFDPRGIGFSGPKVRCDYSGGNTTTPQRRQESSVTSNILSEAWEQNLKSNTACSDANKDTEAKYVGTVANVQDMVHFTELQAALRGKDPKTTLINYYGISYGTLIGQTLVALYPDRLRRVLLDGNVHGVSHYQGWEPTGIDDLAHGIFMFAKLCFEAGPEWCKLAEGMNSIEEVNARLDAAMEKLDKTPVQSPDGSPVNGARLSTIWAGSMSHIRNGGGYGKIVNATLAVENDNLVEYLTEAAAASKSVGNLADPTYKTSDMLTIITAIDIAGRFPWKTYESWKAATMRLVATAKYNSVGYASSNG
jgi:pimeloyl-ACP methyl ester carboxylesterase